ncbi:NfeD family protein [Chloroflexota bacterium]
MKNLLKAIFLVLDEAIIVAVVLVILWKVGVTLSPLVITAVVLLIGAVVFVVYKAITSTSKLEVTGGKKSMLGLSGNAVTPLDPEGLIRARGELWKAECTDGTICAQEAVIIVSIQGLKLIVKRKDDGEQGESKDAKV